MKRTLEEEVAQHLSDIEDEADDVVHLTSCENENVARCGYDLTPLEWGTLEEFNEKRCEPCDVLFQVEGCTCGEHEA